MKKIYVDDFSNSRRVEVYYASEVDARIAELEAELAEAIRQRDLVHDELVHLQNSSL